MQYGHRVGSSEGGGKGADDKHLEQHFIAGGAMF